MYSKRIRIYLWCVFLSTSVLVGTFLVLPPFKGIDPIPPTVQINCPKTLVYSSNQILLDISARDNKEIEKVWYNWNGQNYTYFAPVLITFLEGINELHVWAQDGLGNIAENTTYFACTDKDCFITSWDTNPLSDYSSGNHQIKFPLIESGSYNFIVDWGDGTGNLITSWDDSNAIHTYSSQGVKTIKIAGTLNGWSFNNYGDRLKLMKIQQWGNLRLGNSGNNFNGCENLNITATDILNVTGTTNLKGLFQDCRSIGKIEGISEWDVSSVTDMSYMFYNYWYGWENPYTSFNEDIGSWDVSHVTDMSYMFAGAVKFNQDIGGWNVSQVTNMESMFAGVWVEYIVNYDPYSCFNQDIGNWDVSKVRNMERMFASDTDFNQNISSWNVSKVTNMHRMFYMNYNFNQDIGDWDVSQVTDMAFMFYQATKFNQSIGNWDVSNVKNMDSMFLDTWNFNRSLNNWNVSKVTNMHEMFSNATSYNQNMSNWDVSSVTNMRGMFSRASIFNQNLTKWNVSKVTDMLGMFIWASSFNGDVRNWNVLSVTNMQSLFYQAFKFNQDLGGWDVYNVQNMNSILYDTSLSTANYDSLLINWSQLTLQHGVQFYAGPTKYSAGAAATARTYIINTYGWTIGDGGQV